MLVKNFGFVHISAGDCLRAERDSGSDLAKEINDDIKNGRIVKAEVTIGLLRKTMMAHGWDKAKGFLIDGFPRDGENYEKWFSIMGHEINIKFLLFVDVSEKIMRERINGRAA